MRIPRITYTDVAATLALFIALGGSSYAAATITGSSIRNGAVTSSDLKDGTVKGGDVGGGSLTGSDVKNAAVTSSDLGDASLAAADLASAQLPAGGAGPQGPRGPAGTTDPVARRAVDVPVQPGDLKTGTASCLGGEVAVGGGAGHSGTPDDLVAIMFDEPLEADGSTPEDGEPATQWQAAVHNTLFSGVNSTMTVHVLCARP